MTNDKHILPKYFRAQMKTVQKLFLKKRKKEKEGRKKKKRKVLMPYWIFRKC